MATFLEGACAERKSRDMATRAGRRLPKSGAAMALTTCPSRTQRPLRRAGPSPERGAQAPRPCRPSMFSRLRNKHSRAVVSRWH